MTLKYESELLFDLMKRDGDDAPSDVLPYESELKEKYLHQVEGAYPKLQDYRSEWLHYNLNVHLPADFPFESVSDVTNATFKNVVPYVYRSAILKGSTKYRDIDTGEILESFEEGRNLELVSVKMPVLKTTGKNLFDGKIERGSYSASTKQKIDSDNTRCRNSIIPLIPDGFNGKISISDGFQFYLRLFKGTMVVRESGFTTNYSLDNTSNTFSEVTIVIKKVDNTQFTDDELTTIKIQIEEGLRVTEFEPHKSIILTVNDDVTLRSNGGIYDELNLLTGRLTQRIDENNEVLAQEVVKTVDLSVVDQDGNATSIIRPIEGTMHLSTSSDTIEPTFTGEVPVEAINQNLASFIEE